jgi:hypothetical protein
MNTHGGAIADFKAKEKNLFNQLIVLYFILIDEYAFSNSMITNNLNKHSEILIRF